MNKPFLFGVPIDIMADGTLISGFNRVMACRKVDTIKARIFETGKVVDFKISDIKLDDGPSERNDPGAWAPAGTH